MASNGIEYDSKLFIADEPAVTPEAPEAPAPVQAVPAPPVPPPEAVPIEPSAAVVPTLPVEQAPATSPGIQNLRCSLRFRVEEAMARLYVKGLLTSIGLGRVKRQQAALNLSSGGALLAASEPIEVGTLVHVRIEIPRFSDAIEADGEVAWCSPGEGNPTRFFVGVRFVGLNDAQRGKIEVMRRWFTSPEYKMRRATRRKDKGPSLEITA